MQSVPGYLSRLCKQGKARRKELNADTTGGRAGAAQKYNYKTYSMLRQARVKSANEKERLRKAKTPKHRGQNTELNTWHTAEQQNDTEAKEHTQAKSG